MDMRKAARGELALICAALFCYSAVSNICFSLISSILGESAISGTVGILADTLCFAAGMSCTLLVLDRKERPWQFKKISGLQRNTAVFALPALLLPMQYLSSSVDSVLKGIGITSFEGNLYIPGTPLEAVLLFLQAVALPVFFEEIIFRGLIVTRLRPYGEVFAAITSSLLFCMMHNTLYSLPATFLLGVIFCFADMSCGSLFPSMIMHAVNNGITVLYCCCSGNEELMARFSAALGFLMIFSAVSLPLLLLYLRKTRGRVFLIDKGGFSPAFMFTSIPALGFLAYCAAMIMRVTEVTL